MQWPLQRRAIQSLCFMVLLALLTITNRHLWHHPFAQSFSLKWNKINAKINMAPRSQRNFLTNPLLLAGKMDAIKHSEENRISIDYMLSGNMINHHRPLPWMPYIPDYNLNRLVVFFSKGKTNLIDDLWNHNSFLKGFEQECIRYECFKSSWIQCIYAMIKIKRRVHYR